MIEVAIWLWGAVASLVLLFVEYEARVDLRESTDGIDGFAPVIAALWPIAITVYIVWRLGPLRWAWAGFKMLSPAHRRLRRRRIDADLDGRRRRVEREYKALFPTEEDK